MPKFTALVRNSCLINLRKLISNFFFQIYSFSFLHETLHFEKFTGATFINDKSFFQTPTWKHPNKVFLVEGLKFFVLDEILQFHEFDSDDSKYDRSFVKLWFKNTWKGIFGPKLIFFLKWTFFCLTDSRVLISNKTIAFFQNCSPNINEFFS